MARDYGDLNGRIDRQRGVARRRNDIPTVTAVSHKGGITT